MSKKRKSDEIYVQRLANRKYKFISGGYSSLSVGLFGACGINLTPAEPVKTSEILAAAEYAIYRHPDTTPIARIIKSDGWRVVVAVEDNHFGRAISPIGMDSFTAVKEWAIGHFKEK